jgi:hypothetical protein
VHCAAGILRRDEQVTSHVLRAIVRDDEPEPVLVHLQASDDEFAAETRDDILSSAKLDEVPAIGQTLEGFFELLPALAFCAELAREILE